MLQCPSFSVNRKRKHSLECNQVEASLAAELEFPKILLPRLPHNTANVNNESTGKSKQLYYLCDQLLGALIYLDVFVLMLICFKLIMPYVSYAVIGCCSSRTTLGKTLLQLLLKIVWHTAIWKGKLKTELCILVDFSY